MRCSSDNDSFLSSQLNSNDEELNINKMKPLELQHDTKDNRSERRRAGGIQLNDEPSNEDAGLNMFGPDEALSRSERPAASALDLHLQVP